MKTTAFTFLLSLLITFSTFAQIPPYISPNSLIGYWNFSGNANDISGSGNNATVSKATLTTDRFGTANSAYQFNGNDSRIDVTNAFFDISWNSYTISCWTNSDNFENPNNPNNSQVVFNTSPHNGIALPMYGATNPFTTDYNKKYVLFVGSQPDVRDWDVVAANNFSNTSHTINTWNHFVLVKNGNSYLLYINGVLDKTFTGVKPANSFLCKMVFGNLAADIPNEGFSGKLDDFGIWNRALSETEITNLYNSTPIVAQKTDLSLSSKSLSQIVKKDSTGQISFTLKNEGNSTATNIKVHLKIPYSPPFCYQ